MRNNPLRYTDPSGHWVDEGCGTGGSGGGTGCNLPPPGGCTTCGGGGGGGGGDEDDRRPPRGGGGGNPLPGPIPDPGGGDPLPAPIPDPGIGETVGGTQSACGQQGYYSPDCSGWHYYRTANMVCPANLHCTEAQIQDYLYRFAFPGQDPNSPVRDTVQNFVWVNGIIPLGYIRTRVDGSTITNITELHLMYDGQVQRHAMQTSDGSWFIVTTGMGNNVPIPIIQAGPVNAPYQQVRSVDFSAVNQALGPGAFNDLDQDMLDYIVEHQ